MFYLGLGSSCQSKSPPLCFPCVPFVFNSIKLQYSLWKCLGLVLRGVQCLDQTPNPPPFTPFPGTNGCMWHPQLQIISLLCSSCLGPFFCWIPGVTKSCPWLSLVPVLCQPFRPAWCSSTFPNSPIFPWSTPWKPQVRGNLNQTGIEWGTGRSI